MLVFVRHDRCCLRVGHYLRSETLTEHDLIRNKLKFLGCCLDRLGVQERGEPLPGMFVLGVVVVRQHRGAHVPLEFLQCQIAPLVARRWSSGCHGDPGEAPLLMQREAASVSKFSELMHDEGDPPLEVLDEILDLVGWPSFPDEPLAVLVFGHEVAPRTQTDDSHSAIINTGRTCWQIGSRGGRQPGYPADGIPALEQGEIVAIGRVVDQRRDQSPAAV